MARPCRQVPQARALQHFLLLLVPLLVVFFPGNLPKASRTDRPAMHSLFCYSRPWCAPGQESRQPRRGAEIPGRLLERSTELGNIEVAVKQKEQILNNLKALNAEQEKDVQRVRQREKLLKKAELIKKKLP